MRYSSVFLIVVLFFTRNASAQQNPYPQQYFRQPLNIPLQLVANFGEIRSNHWHMGLDIRTQQRVNLPVYAAADGYISRVSVEPGGFGQAIYIDHANGYTTVYGHLNAFFPALAFYIKQQQYQQESWKVNITLPTNLFRVNKGDFIAYSGSTGASEGPHVHFEIRDTKTENCLNPLLFGFPIADGVAPSISRLAMYDRNRSTYDQSPQFLSLKRNGNTYTAGNGLIEVGSNKISFAVAATDRFTGSANPNGIYSARVMMDDKEISGFFLDDISYLDTRMINAQLDYPYKSRGGASLQHITPLPGARSVAYSVSNEDGCIRLRDTSAHNILIEVRDANFNLSSIRFRVKFNPSLVPKYAAPGRERFLPEQVNIFERDDFELYTSERAIYDTVMVVFRTTASTASNSASPVFHFLSASVPSQDSITVRIRPSGLQAGDRVLIRNVCGARTYVSRAEANRDGWFLAKFRQFGSYQALVDNTPPTINNPPSDLSKATRIVFVPSDDSESIRSFRAELDGNWLRFTNDKGSSWIYTMDEKFARGEHALKVSIEDEAGNITTKTWTVRR